LNLLGFPEINYIMALIQFVLTQPTGYFVICQRDTLNVKGIYFAEGDSVDIKQPGGDRASYSQSFIFTNGKLIALK
jgi:hypothetical protein